MENEESVFHAASKLPPGDQREALLASKCGGNVELRDRVEGLLRAHDSAGSFLERPPTGVSPEYEQVTVRFNSEDDTAKSGELFLPTTTLPGLDPCDTPGRIGKLSAYEVIELVGQGGMGSVLKAWDTKLHRVVALKLMSSELASNPQAKERFLREARSAAAVVHDHVVTIHAIEDDRDSPLLAMEYVEGETLQQKISREGALPADDVVRLGTQMAQGLAAAHAIGLVHRDIKPANVLLTQEIGRAKITDFGLARAIDNAELTQSGMILGTPQYMSPEQARGEIVDHRTDLFSLGSVLYAMCTGQSAFPSESTVGALTRVCNDTPTPIRQLNPEMPPWLAATINRLMEKKAEDRYQSASEVAETLANATAGQASKRRRFPIAWMVALSLLAGAISSELTGFTHLRSLAIPTPQPPSAAQRAKSGPQALHGLVDAETFWRAVDTDNWTPVKQVAREKLASSAVDSIEEESDALKVLLRAEDYDNFRRFSNRAIKQNASSQNFWRHFHFASVVVLPPPGEGDLEAMAASVERADRLVTSDLASADRRSLAGCQCLLKYRQGEYRAAIELADPLIRDRAPAWGSGCMLYAAAALSHHRLGNTKQANRYVNRLDRALPSWEERGQMEQWESSALLSRQILMKEIRATIPAGEPLPPTPEPDNLPLAKTQPSTLYGLVESETFLAALDTGDWTPIERVAREKLASASCESPVEEACALTALVHAEDYDSFRRYSTHAIERESNSQEYWNHLFLAYTALLPPAREGDLEAMAASMAKVNRLAPSGLDAPGRQVLTGCRSLLEYRQGDYRAAVEIAEPLISDGAPPWASGSMLYAAAAMSHYRLGNTWQASDYLDRLEQGTSLWNQDWKHVWASRSLLDHRVLLREVRATIPPGERLSPQYYLIESVRRPGQVLDVFASGTSHATNVALYGRTEGMNQLWRFLPAGNGYYYLESKLGRDLVLDISGWGVADQTNIQIVRKGPGTTAQQFKRIPREGNVIQLESAMGSRFKIGIAEDEVNVVSRTGDRGDKQLFKLVPVSDGPTGDE